MWETGPDADHKDKGVSGLADNGSRWGIKGSSDISDGLSAVYQFETKIDSTDASNPGGRLSYAGISGGFGTLTMGQLWSASYNHIGGIQDIGNVYGGGDFTARTADTISYAVSVGSLSFQADIQGNKGGGTSNKNPVTVYGAAADTAAAIEDEGDPWERPAAAAEGVEDKAVDSGQFGATMALGENGKIAVAYIDNDTIKHEKNTKAYLMGQYLIGGVALHLGMGQHKHDNRLVFTGEAESNTDVADVTINETKKVETVYAGASGGLGDTGVNFNVSFQNRKTSGQEVTGDADGDDTADDLGLSKRDANKHSPWVVGLSRNLGGGAIVYVEHMNPDMDNVESSTAIGLRVDF